MPVDSSMIQTIGTVVVALMGGGIVKALVDYARNRSVSKLEHTQFDFSTLKDLNDLLRKDLNLVREELATERTKWAKELEEERFRRQAVEEELRLAKSATARLEVRVAELEQRS